MKPEIAGRVRLLLLGIVAAVVLDFAGSLLYGYLVGSGRDKLFTFDPEIGFIHRPNVRLEVPWPEAASGAIVYQTNNLGLREDRPTDERSPAQHRVMVFGDSHTDGVVNNKDSFSHVAETLLNSEGHETVEVLNAGIGLSCLRQHAKLFERLRFLQPDVVVFTIFVGNDYADILHSPEPPTLYDRWSRYSVILRGLRHLDFSPRMRAERVNRYAMWQSLAQADYFQQHPEDMGRASQLHKELLGALAAECRQVSIRFLVLIMPTKYLVERQQQSDDFAAIERLLGLDPERRTDESIRSDLRVMLTSLRIPFIDLYPLFSSNIDSTGARQLFWKADHHLSEWGHAITGRALADSIGAMLSSER
jgi:hypothetical protein